MKYFRMSYEEVVFERSYINLLLLNAAIPGCKPYEGKNDEDNEISLDGSEESENQSHASTYFMNFM